MIEHRNKLKIHRILYQNKENHNKLNIPRQNYENHEIHRIPRQNNENQENL